LEELKALPVTKITEVTEYMLKAYSFSTAHFGPVVDGYVVPESLDEIAAGGKQYDIPYMLGSTADDIYPDQLYHSNCAWSLLLENLGRDPAFIYYFDRSLPGDNAGAFHSAELWYEFGTLDRCWRPFEPIDNSISEAMVLYFSQFIKTGNPNAEELPEWIPFSEKSPRVMRIGRKIQMDNVMKEVLTKKLDKRHLPSL
jgi:para-nitrobenzyl esterase